MFVFFFFQKTKLFYYDVIALDKSQITKESSDTDYRSEFEKKYQSSKFLEKF